MSLGPVLVTRGRPWIHCIQDEGSAINGAFLQVGTGRWGGRHLHPPGLAFCSLIHKVTGCLPCTGDMRLKIKSLLILLITPTGLCGNSEGKRQEAAGQAQHLLCRWQFPQRWHKGTSEMSAWLQSTMKSNSLLASTCHSCKCPTQCTTPLPHSILDPSLLQHPTALPHQELPHIAQPLLIRRLPTTLLKTNPACPLLAYLTFVHGPDPICSCLSPIPHWNASSTWTRALFCLPLDHQCHQMNE